jgi:TatD DNase family protein
MLIDSHCHLDRLHLFGGTADLDTVLDQARSRGVGGFLAIGVDLESSRNLVKIAQRYRDVYVSVGAHPLQDQEITVPEVADLLALAAEPDVVAIGETGLDYYYSADSKSWQQASFVNHLEAAKACGKPVVVHTRDAMQDTLELISAHGCRQTGGVLHCFTESWEMARAALDLNFYISFSGIITFRNADELREVVKKVPLDRMLVETDSPWLAPVPYRGKANVPGYVVEVAHMVAQVKGISVEKVESATTENFGRLFNVGG